MKVTTHLVRRGRLHYGNGGNAPEQMLLPEFDTQALIRIVVSIRGYAQGVRERKTYSRDAPASFADIHGELDLIEWIKQRSAVPPSKTRTELRFGIGDDCAILRPRRGEEIVVTTDFSLEGRHFRRDWHSSESIGHRILARGLSDLAAMGARPVAAFLSLALPRTLLKTPAVVETVLEGLMALADRMKIPLAGGDTSEAPGEHLLADIVLLGAVPQSRALRRDKARAGDLLYVSGALGGSFAQLRSLAQGSMIGSMPVQDPADDSEPQLFPQPRLRTGSALLRRKHVRAAIDISDGLSTDLRHLCHASHLCAEIEADRLPLHPLLASWEQHDQLSAALHGGEDYELLFTAPADVAIKSREGGVPVTKIGRMRRCKPGRATITLLNTDGSRMPLEAGGWEHLR